MIVAARMVEDRRRGLLWWTAGVVALIAFTVVLFPTVRGNQDFEELSRNLPVAMRDMFSISEVVPITSAPGYLQARLFGSLLTLLILVFAIGAGARATAGSEENGTLELLLANPVSRAAVMLDRYLALVVLVAAVAGASFLAIVLLGWPFKALEDVSISGLAAACTGGGLLALLHGTVAFTVGAATGRRAAAIAVAATVAVGGYLVNGLGGVAPSLNSLQPLSPWHWYLDTNMVAAGPDLKAIVVPAVVTLALALPATPLFQRRDLR